MAGLRLAGGAGAVSVFEGLADDLGAGVGAELGQDVGDVGLHGQPNRVVHLWMSR